MHTSAIYKIENTVNGKVYIGQSSWLEKRFTAHVNCLKNGAHSNAHLQRAWNKYGENAFRFDVVEYCVPESLNDREIYWIGFYDSFKNGYNQTLGGGGNRGYRYSEDARKHMKLNHPDFSGDKNPMYGQSIKDHMTPEAYEKWRITHALSLRGRKRPSMSDAQKEALSKSRKEYYKTHTSPRLGQKMSPETKSKIMDTKLKNGTYAHYLGENYNVKSVTCVNTGRQYSCIKEAAMDTGATASSISMCVNHGDRRTSGVGEDGNRLVWMLTSTYIKLTPEERIAAVNAAQNPAMGSKNVNSKTVYCSTTGESFGSVMDAARKYGIDNSTICKKCRSGGGFCGTYDGKRLFWEYK